MSKPITSPQKQAIADALRQFCTLQGSQNQAAKVLRVSAATVSHILAGQFDDISDDMLRTIAASVNHSANQWNIAPTATFRQLSFLLTNAQADSLCLAIVGAAGTGKTQTIRTYAAAHPRTYHLICSEYWNRRIFIHQLASALGIRHLPSTPDQIDAIIRRLRAIDHPILILDEADKLADQVLHFFITLYNHLESHCALILIATDFLRLRILRGLRLGRRGYEEIYSRVGRRFIPLEPVTPDDITIVCQANHLTESADIRPVITSADADLRRVRRAVWAHHKSTLND